MKSARLIKMKPQLSSPSASSSSSSSSPTTTGTSGVGGSVYRSPNHSQTNLAVPESPTSATATHSATSASASATATSASASASATSLDVVPSFHSTMSLSSAVNPTVSSSYSPMAYTTTSSNASASTSSLVSDESSSLFFGGFLGCLESGKYSDLDLVVEGKHYPVHRIIIAHSSEYFRRLLDSSFQEKDLRVVELKYEDCGEVFPVFLKYLYEGRIELNEANAIPLLALSDRFLVDKLKNQCLNYIEKRITRETCFTVCKQALEYHMEDVQQRCIRVIAKNFHSIYTADFSFLPFNILLSLCKLVLSLISSCHM